MYGDFGPIKIDYSKALTYYMPPKCKHCGGTTEVIPGNPNGYTKYCCEQAKEDEELKVDAKAISRLKSRGYQVIKAKLKRCPNCGSAALIMFTADEDLCTDCKNTFPGT